MSLGISNNNENTTDGMIRIMQEIHPIVPGHNTDDLTQIFFVGDLLTVERAHSAHADLQNSKTLSKRMDGFIPALADFHTYGNFLEVKNCLCILMSLTFRY